MKGGQVHTMEEETNLKNEIKKLNENFQKLIESGKIKGVKAKKLGKIEQKKGYVRYIFIGENKQIKVMKIPIEEGTTMVEGIPRIATADYMLNWDGQPTIIQPAWSVEPFSPVKNYEESVQKQMTAQGHKLLLNRIELGGIKAKKKISGAVIFFIIVILAIAAYMLLGK